MPVVQKYGGTRVSTAAIPGARKTAHETSLSTGAEFARAKGAADAAGAQGLANLAEQGSRFLAAEYGRVVEEEKRKADEVALLDYENALDSFTNKRLHGEGDQGGALATKGEASFELPETVGEEFDKVAGELEGKLSTDRQRAAAAKIRANKKQGLELMLYRHVDGERQAYSANQLEAYVGNRVNSAIQNSNDLNLAQADIEAAVSRMRAVGPSLGITGEALDAKVNNIVSASHEGIVNRLLDNGETEKAKAYLEEAVAAGQIKGDKIGALEKAVKEGDDRKQGQVQADQIIAQGGTLTEQMERASKIEDAEVREETERRLRAHKSDVDYQERVDAENRMRSVYDGVESRKNLGPENALRALEATPEWRKLSDTERARARAYTLDRAQGIPTKTDLGTFYGLMRQAGEAPELFAERNLMAERYRLDEGDFKQLANLQLSIRKGDRTAADRELDSFRTNNQVLEDTLTLYGLDPNAKANTDEGKSIAQLRRLLDRRVEAFHATTGKKATNSDVQEMLDGILAVQSTQPGSWWNLFPGGKPFYDQKVPLINMKVGDIPQAERTAIEQALRAQKMPVTDTTVLDLFLEMKVRRGGVR